MASKHILKEIQVLKDRQELQILSFLKVSTDGLC